MKQDMICFNPKFFSFRLRSGVIDVWPAKLEPSEFVLNPEAVPAARQWGYRMAS